MTYLPCLGLNLHLIRPKCGSFSSFKIKVTSFYLDFPNQMLRAVTAPCLVTVVVLLRLLRVFCISLALVPSTLHRHNLFFFITFSLLSSLVFQHVTPYSHQND